MVIYGTMTSPSLVQIVEETGTVAKKLAMGAVVGALTPYMAATSLRKFFDYSSGSLHFAPHSKALVIGFYLGCWPSVAIFTAGILEFLLPLPTESQSLTSKLPLFGDVGNAKLLLFAGVGNAVSGAYELIRYLWQKQIAHNSTNHDGNGASVIRYIQGGRNRA